MSGADELEVELRLLRLEYALAGLAVWLVQAQSGLGERDVRAIDDILAGKRDEEMQEVVRRAAGGGAVQTGAEES